jgi:hypothetical protein
MLRIFSDGAYIENDLSDGVQVERVSIFGLGNVALDCARVLLKTDDVLGRTDIAKHAQEALSRSAVKRVDIIGRRGPVQAGHQEHPCLQSSLLHPSADTMPREPRAYASKLLLSVHYSILSLFAF